MITQDDIDRIRNIRNYVGDAAWLESLAERLELLVAPAEEPETPLTPEDWWEAEEEEPA